MPKPEPPKRTPPPSRRTLRRLPAEERRAQILDHAAEVFAQKGFNGAKTRDIARACGVSEAVIFHHFETKAVLFHAALERKLAAHDVQTFLDELGIDRPLVDVFSEVATKILRIGLDDMAVHRLLLTASLAGLEGMSNVYVTWRLPFIDHLRQVISRGIERGELRPVDPLLTARAFVGLVMDCVLSCHLWNRAGQKETEPDALIRNNVPTFVLGLLKENPAKPERAKE